MNASRSAARAPRAARGAALILVLWLLVLLTAVIGGFAQSARIEAMQAHRLRTTLVARQAAREYHHLPRRSMFNAVSVIRAPCALRSVSRALGADRSPRTRVRIGLVPVNNVRMSDAVEEHLERDAPFKPGE